MKKNQYYLSGSSFSIAQKCAASVTIEFSKKLMSDGQEASEGTDAHEVIANDIESMRRFLPVKHDKLTEYVERRLETDYDKFWLSGGVDYFAIDYRDGVLYVTDWKTGPMGIDHLGPAQLEFYAYLILMDLAASQRKKITSVILALVSPRLNQKKTFTVSVNEILALSEKFDAILQAIEKKQKPQTGEHCRYCNKSVVCPELRAELIRFTEPKFQGQLVKLTAQDLKLLTIAATKIDDIKKYAKELIEHGTPIPGTRLEWRNSARVFSQDIDGASIAKALGVRLDSISEVKIKSPAQLEKAGFKLDKVNDFITLTGGMQLKIDVEGGAKAQKTKPQKIKVKGKS